MRDLFPAHLHIFAIVWFVLAVRLRRDEQCHLASDAERRLANRLSSESRLPAWAPIFGGLHPGSRLASKRSPYLPSPRSESCHTCTRLPARLSRSNGTSDLCAPFPRSKTRRDSTFPREVPGGPLALFSRFSLRVSGTLQEASSAARLLNICIRKIDHLHP